MGRTHLWSVGEAVVAANVVYGIFFVVLVFDQSGNERFLFIALVRRQKNGAVDAHEPAISHNPVHWNPTDAIMVLSQLKDFEEFDIPLMGLYLFIFGGLLA